MSDEDQPTDALNVPLTRKSRNEYLGDQYVVYMIFGFWST